MEYIYVVFGSAGMYDEYSTWPVVAFSNDADAQVYATACQDAARLAYTEYRAARDAVDLSIDLPDDVWHRNHESLTTIEKDARSKIGHLDSNMDIDYQSTYSVARIAFKG
jgi:hypothetical protein